MIVVNKTTQGKYTTLNKEYVVYGIMIYNNQLNYLIRSDFDNSYWFKADLFEIKVHETYSLPYFDSQEIVCGYKELVQNEDHYNGICNLEKKDLELFDIRKKQIEMNGMIPWYWKQQRLNEKKGISMKLICQSNSALSLEPAMRQKLSLEEATSFNLSIGSVYIAYGMYAVNGALFYLLLGENSNFPTLYPAELFAFKDQLLPIEWYFNYTQKKEAIWGYKPLALDPHYLALLLEQDPKAVSLFENYKNQIDEWERMP